MNRLTGLIASSIAHCFTFVCFLQIFPPFRFNLQDLVFAKTFLTFYFNDIQRLTATFKKRFDYMWEFCICFRQLQH